MAEQLDNLSGQYLSYKLDDEVFALEIGKVREVLEYKGVTKVPRTPDFMRGVINLRGSVVPVIDLKLKFGAPETEAGVDTCVIIVEVNVDGKTTILGLLADSVQEVFEQDAEEIEPAPRIGTWVKTGFIKGMAKREEQFLILLDIDKVFAGDALPSSRELELGAIAVAGDEGIVVGAEEVNDDGSVPVGS